MYYSLIICLLIIISGLWLTHCCVPMPISVPTLRMGPEIISGSVLRVIVYPLPHHALALHHQE